MFWWPTQEDTRMKRHHLMILTGFICLLMQTSLWAQEPMGLSVSPQSITIGTNYNGTTVIVSGKIPEDCDAVAVVTGDRKELHLKEKGKALGVLWMNMGTLTYHNVPNVFIVSSAKKIADMAGQVGDDVSSVKNIGLDGLSKLITVEAKNLSPETAISELLKLKKNDGLYQEQTGNISYAASAQGYKTFRINVAIPSRLSPGTYTVNVCTIKNGQIIDRADTKIDAKLTGAPAFLSTLAFGHSLLYGILATLIAIIGGLIIGFIFQGAKGGAH